jgi:nucleoside-diphosphate-sugar epimerase
MRINVEGTRNLLGAAESEMQDMPFILTSSVAVYGIPEADDPPLDVGHALATTDIYSESKILSESLVRSSSVAYTILRVSGVYSADRIEPPETLQFKREPEG